ncbi:MAG: hypothetical protein CG438_1370 [Methylococcaceae bacterium NSP1-1]|nr:MAG: hypothetical protein CG438_1370 [Methylococcaceae bacterium NSP1-1]
MKRAFTLEYWQDDGWYVGKLREVPGVFSQGETLEELEENIEDAYKLLIEEELQTNHPISQVKEVLVDVGNKHDIYANPANGKQTPIPRHSEIKDTLCQLIRKQLGL